jgi:thiopurine S-methyltransferase
MEKSFWQARWDRQEIGFHATSVNADLVEAFEALSEGGARVFSHALVPLCGKSLDLGWLATRVGRVTGVEFVPEAARAFFSEAGVTPAEGRVGAHRALSHGSVTIVIGDFFALDPADLGPIDLCYDRAALIALPPAMRERYAAQCARLVSLGARGVIVTLDHDPALRGGPPFPVTDADVEALYREAFTLERLARRVPRDPPRGLAGHDVFTSTWALTRR